jgi:rhodanese-related sulfurtransferase
VPHASAESAIPELSAGELAALRERGEPHLLLDVREVGEHARARIEGSQLIPLAQLEAALGSLADWRERKVVVHCHHGGRSARACDLMRAHGFRDVSNLRGGIDAWSLSVDPAVPRY